MYRERRGRGAIRKEKAGRTKKKGVWSPHTLEVKLLWLVIRSRKALCLNTSLSATAATQNGVTRSAFSQNTGIVEGIILLYWQLPATQKRVTHWPCSPHLTVRSGEIYDIYNAATGDSKGCARAHPRAAPRAPRKLVSRRILLDITLIAEGLGYGQSFMNVSAATIPPLIAPAGSQPIRSTWLSFKNFSTEIYEVPYCARIRKRVVSKVNKDTPPGPSDLRRLIGPLVIARRGRARAGLSLMICNRDENPSWKLVNRLAVYTMDVGPLVC
ncbi:hypothetical protein EVAR_103729_1 [Eumeta japonica]|uniref:Uncharacterized protein n=1 Tax=Eumeta variegata TaxID=151549 RepID=A0A4C1ZIE1_EUMVA|nr:hypothetical protein EVAR_103729_1 [Eumeta japonica]